MTLNPLHEKPIRLNSSLSAGSLFQVTPAKPHITFLHLVLCLPCLFILSLGCHSVILEHMICPAHVPFFLLIMVKISSTLVCSLIHDALILSYHVMPSIILSIPLGRTLVRLQVSDPRLN